MDAVVLRLIYILLVNARLVLLFASPFVSSKFWKKMTKTDKVRYREPLVVNDEQCLEASRSSMMS